MNNITFSFLKFVNFTDLSYWTTKRFLTKELVFSKKYPLKLFGYFLEKITPKTEHILDDKDYPIIGVRSYGIGAYINRISPGKNLKMKKYQLAEENHLIWCKVDTKNGAFGIVTSNLKNSYASSNMALAKINNSRITNEYLQLIFRSKKIQQYMDSFVSGTTNRKYIKIDELLSKIQIPLPDIEQQKRIVKRYNDKIKLAEGQEQNANDLEKNIEKYIFEMLGLKINKNTECAKLQFVAFMNIKLWGADKIAGNNAFTSNKYKLLSLSDNSNLYLNVFRGKSPKYEDNTEAIILNQKCNRWNRIDLKFAKTVSGEWLKSIDSSFKTKENDVIVNSTGEGTIGRATCIDKEHTALLYDSHILLLRLNTELVNPLYYTYLLNSNFGQEQINYIKSAQSTKQTELGIDNLKLIKFPYPELEVQNKMVEHIKELNANIINLRKQAEKNRLVAQEEFEKELFE